MNEETFYEDSVWVFDFYNAKGASGIFGEFTRKDKLKSIEESNAYKQIIRKAKLQKIMNKDENKN